MAMPSQTIGLEAVQTKGWWLAHRWLVLRRVSQFSIMALFLMGPVFNVWLIKGNLASSLLFDSLPMMEPHLFLQMWLAGHNFSVNTALIGVGVVSAFYFLVGGRVYCAWVCPVNVVTDAAHWLRNKLGIKQGIAIRRNTRYWALGMTLVLSFISGSLAYEVINPVSMLHRGLIYGFGFGAITVLAIFLFDLFSSKRGWCSHLCPMGALYSLLGKFSPLKVRGDKRAQCDQCNECYLVCPEPQVLIPVLRGKDKGIGPVIDSGACTNCGRCIDICAEDVFHFGLRYRKTDAAHQAEHISSQNLIQISAQRR